MKKLFWAVLAAVLVLAGCETAELKTGAVFAGDGGLTLMTWNVHNLYDGIDDGLEYDEFKTSSGWSEEKYLGRINVISGAISKIEPLPDIIMLQEIESLRIPEDLAASLSDSYKWSHFAKNPNAALGVGLLSRIPISDVKTHSITVNGETTPRPVLEARIQAGENEFVIFVCHWKSKLGGDEATEIVRRASARAILRRIRELRESEPDTGVIVAGDLNENYDEFYRQEASMICALLPDDPYCALLSGCDGEEGQDASRQKDFLVISGNMPPEPVHFPQDSIVLFSPWLGELEDAASGSAGSYFYKHNWETIDHFLISAPFFNNEGWEYEKTTIANFEPFVNNNGTPAAYNSRTGAGLSDHVPLLLVLKLAEN